MLLNIPCELSHCHSSKLYMVYVKRDYKSSVSFFQTFCLCSVLHLPLFYM